MAYPACKTCGKRTRTRYDGLCADCESKRTAALRAEQQRNQEAKNTHRATSSEARS